MELDPRLIDRYANVCHHRDVPYMKNSNPRQTRILLPPKLISGDLNVSELNSDKEELGNG